MGVVVCATHYTGMGAATYSESDENYIGSTRYLLCGKSSAEVASNSALFVCCWLTTFDVFRFMSESKGHQVHTGRGEEC